MTDTAALCAILSYDSGRYPFVRMVRELFAVEDLAALHERYPKPPDASGDQDTPAHEVFYREFERVRLTYERFLREVVAPLYGEDLCVQQVPTFRVHYPGTTAVREYHRDSDYHHQPEITNYWLPLTPAFATNTIWIETRPGSEQFRPVEVSPGYVLRFSAVALKHGNQPNQTPVSRVSFDFRVLPLREHRDSGLTTVSSGRRLGLGDYYMLLARDGQFSHRDGTAP